MKIRQGFVSNSSSSSFCIYGIQFDSPNKTAEAMKNGDPVFVKKFISDFNEAYSEELDQPVTTMDELFDAVDDLELYLSEFLYEYFFDFEKTDFFIGGEYNEELVSIGREWSSIGDKETGEDFKNSVKKDLEYFFGKNISLHTCEESYRC